MLHIQFECQLQLQNYYLDDGASIRETEPSDNSLEFNSESLTSSRHHPDVSKIGIFWTNMDYCRALKKGPDCLAGQFVLILHSPRALFVGKLREPLGW